MHNHESYNLSNFESTIGYTFNDKSLLSLALTHPSLSLESEHPEVNYQRLEFLGDAVLTLILANHLYRRYPEDREGILTSLLSALTKGSFLVKVAKQLELQNFVKLSKAEIKHRGHLRPSTLEDALEAIAGAIFIDSNFGTTESVIMKWYEALNINPRELLLAYNPKGQLQEFIYKYKPETRVRYSVVEEVGPDHNKLFTVAIIMNNKIVATAMANSKKIAAQNAAKEALSILESQKENLK